MSDKDTDDEQFEKAKQAVIGAGKCSASWLQRELGTSFTVASALVTRLEEEGVVSEAAGNGQRTVLITDGDDAGEEDDAEAGHDYEGEHNVAVDRIENMAEELEIDPRKMVEQVRDFMLDVIKTRPRPWSGTSQSEKRDIAAACENAANDVVRKVVEAVAARGVDPVRILLTKVTMAGDVVIAGKVKAFDPVEEHKAISILHGALSKHVMLTVASKDDYSSGDESEESEEFDEPDFAFEGDDEEEPDTEDADGDEAQPDPVTDAAVDAALGEMAEEYEVPDAADENAEG